MKSTINFINLTNGIEAIERENLKEYQFIRIESSILESKCWDQFVNNIDNNFLMNLAIGNKCIVYDYSANKMMPRSLYQGIELLKFILERRWFNRETPFVIRNVPINDGYYDKIYLKIKFNKKLIKKIDYFKRFLNTDKLDIVLIAGRTDLDGKYDIYRDILLDKLK